jgi:hypothetical protein
LKNAMWQTFVSTISPWNSTPFASRSLRAPATSSTCSAMKQVVVGAQSMPAHSGFHNEKHVWPAQNSASRCSSWRSPSVSL